MAPSRTLKDSQSTQRGSDVSAMTRVVRNVLASMQERKVSSFQSSGTIISSTGTVLNVTNQIIEGDDINQRSGTSIFLKKMHFRFAFQGNIDDQSARFIIFRDNMNTGTTPTVTEVLPTTGYLSHFSDTRQIQQRRYTVLFDNIIDVSVTGPTRFTRHKEIKCQGKVNYNAATAVAAANGKGALFLLVIGSKSTGNFDYDWQLEYTDA